MESRRISTPFMVVALLLITGSHALFAEAQAEQLPTGEHELTGYASWYAGKFQGRLTANGERFDTNELTAAHKTLPFNTVVQVTHLESGRTVTVRINDRGPFVEGRVIDLSRVAADRLGMAAEGIAQVELRIISKPELRYVVQIASFSSSDNAGRLMERLIAQGIAVQRELSETLHRVVVTDVKEDELPALREALARAGHPNPLVREEWTAP